MKKTILFLKVMMIALLLSSNASALTIVGGSELISSSDTILQDWLGQGPITLTSIYSSTPEDTGATFHAAVDGKGPTISLVKVAETGEIIGGYNPASWSTEGWIMATSPYEAFIFNLTNSAVRYQSNDYKTYDSIDFGPTFGGGYDFKAVPGAQGFSYAYSYLAEVPNGPAVYPMGYPGIVGGDGTFTAEKIEVFTITLGEAAPADTTTGGFPQYKGKHHLKKYKTKHEKKHEKKYKHKYKKNYKKKYEKKHEKKYGKKYEDEN
jgi:hypothetical protein